MARKPNYGFEKRQKEILRAKKNEEKEERKRLRKEQGEDYIPPELFGGGVLAEQDDATDAAPGEAAPDDSRDGRDGTT